MSKYIIIDSREKPKAIGKILDHFDKSGIEYEVSKLLFGDYMDWNRPGIVVDRKQNIATTNRSTDRRNSLHRRFWRQIEVRK